MNQFTPIIFFFLLVVTGCNLSDGHIKKHSWKYCGGTRLADFGDIVEFNGYYSLKNDTIFKKNIPVAKITETDKSSLRARNKIIIESILTKEKGDYCEK